MSRWIGGDGLGSVSGAVYDSQDRIVIGQSHRRSRGGLIRYTAAGARDYVLCQLETFHQMVVL